MPGFSSHQVPTVPQPPHTASTPLPPYRSRPPSVIEVDLVSDSEEEEASTVEVTGVALAHQVRNPHDRKGGGLVLCSIIQWL